MIILELELYLIYVFCMLVWMVWIVFVFFFGIFLGGFFFSFGLFVWFLVGIGREWFLVGFDWNKKLIMNVYIKCCYYFFCYYF